MDQDHDDDDPCPSCGVEVGELHRDGCDVEQCPYCGGQFIGCACTASDVPSSELLPWTGELPGVAECLEFGWRKEGSAELDLGRLGRDARWDRKLKRWVTEWHLSMPAYSFNDVLAIGWDLPDEALVRITVSESACHQENDAHHGRFHPDVLIPEGDTERDQYLVARVGGWECYPMVRFRSRCANYPGVCFRLGDLRAAWRLLLRGVRMLGKTIDFRFCGEGMVAGRGRKTYKLQAREEA